MSATATNVGPEGAEGAEGAGSKRPREDGQEAGTAESDEAAAKRSKTAEENAAAAAAAAPVAAAAPAVEAPVVLPEGVFSGVVKWFDVSKGYGFLVRDDGQDVFVHQSSCVKIRPGAKGLEEGEKVWFQMNTEQNGKLRAEQVTGPNGAPAMGQVDAMTAAQYGYMMPGQAAMGGMLATPGVMAEHTTTTLAPGKYRGHCKWFNPSKGFGFIVPQDGSGDVFCHNSACYVTPGAHKSLAENENVEYELTEEQGKKKAKNVTGPGGAYCIGQPRPADPSQAMGMGMPMGMMGYGMPAMGGMPMAAAPMYAQYGYPQQAQAAYGAPPPGMPAQQQDTSAQYGAYYGQAGMPPAQPQGYGGGGY